MQQIFESIKECEKNLLNVFEVEKARFEDKNGIGTYDNKSWRGYMASYMCVFPAQYLDELKDVIIELPLIARMLDISLINNAYNRSILITGKGGIGENTFIM